MMYAWKILEAYTKLSMGDDIVEWSRNEACAERKTFYLNFFNLFIDFLNIYKYVCLLQ